MKAEIWTTGHGHPLPSQKPGSAPKLNFIENIQQQVWAMSSNMMTIRNKEQGSY